MLVTIGVAAVVSQSSGLSPVILITSLTIYPVTISGTLTDGLMAKNRARAISGATLWAGLLLTVASVIAALQWKSATALAAAYVVGPFVNMILLARYSRTEYGPIVLRWRPRHWRSLLRRAAPFFRISILSMIIGRLDTIVVSWMFGQSMAGAYAAATGLADRLAILIDSVASAVLPTLTRLRTESKRLQEVLAEMMYPLLAILSGGALIGMASSTAIVTVIFGEKFAAGGPALAVGLAFLPIFALDTLLAEGFLAIRRDHFVVRTGVRGQFATLLLIPALPWVFGMIGARLARIGTSASVISRFLASREAFPGLWDRVRYRRLFVSVLSVLPIVAILAFTTVPPLAHLLIAIVRFRSVGGAHDDAMGHWPGYLGIAAGPAFGATRVACAGAGAERIARCRRAADSSGVTGCRAIPHLLRRDRLLQRRGDACGNARIDPRTDARAG